MKVHFIAIGGSAMHNLAIALHNKGYRISGSDDEIFEPSKGRLQRYGLLPENFGWFPEKLHGDIDAVILGMHARADNPELARARELGLPIFSYPEYLYEQSKNKTRIVIGGSHGKTTITAMVLHVLHVHRMAVDYMVGAQLAGFDVMVSLSDNAPVMVIEGDEYLSSPIDPRPKFHIYKPHIALISGIAWDHINVFPSFENYLDQFRRFIHCIEENGKLIYCQDDELVRALCEEEATGRIHLFPYSLPVYRIRNGRAEIMHQEKWHQTEVFGRHNILNIGGARLICQQLGITDDMFFNAICTYKGASNRLEKIYQNNDLIIFRDFAHAPSKIRASTQAVKEFFPYKRLIACMELHTYSSLNEHFLVQYKEALEMADDAVVFFDPGAVALKKLPFLQIEKIYESFSKPGLKIFHDTEALKGYLYGTSLTNSIFLFMSSGNFGGLNFNDFFRHIENRNEKQHE